MLERFLLVWLVLLSGLAYYWPAFKLPFDPFHTPKPVLDGAFALTMFLIGSLLPLDEVRQVRQRWPAVLGGTAVQYLTMPALAYVVGRLAGLPTDLFLGVIVVGCVPGAMASNLLTLAARGNVSYSVSLTTLAMLLSPLVVPAALWVTLGMAKKIDPLGVSFKLLWQVVGPVVLGHLLARRFARWQRWSQGLGPPVANLTILWIIAAVVATKRERLGQALGAVALVLLLINVLGYAAGFLAGKLMRLPRGMRRALTLEIGMQNAGLGTLLALDLFRDLPAAAVPPAAYTFGCMLTGTLLAGVWSLSAREGSEGKAGPDALTGDSPG
jgi:BASS family bile acid:Na+ symporter